MNLSIRTSRALRAAEIEAIKEKTGLNLIADSNDFARNRPPSFPLFKSEKPNYVLCKGDKVEDCSDDYTDEEFEKMENMGRELQDIYPQIVHTYPD